MKQNWSVSRRNERRGRKMAKRITTSGRDKVIVHSQAKDLNSVYFSWLCKSTLKWMTKMQAQCMSQTSAAAGGVGTLNGLPAKARCSPAHNCYLSIDHSRPSKHARHGQSHSQVFKTKGNLYTGPVFQPVCYLFCILSHGNFTDTGLTMVFGHLDTHS